MLLTSGYGFAVNEVGGLFLKRLYASEIVVLTTFARGLTVGFGFRMKLMSYFNVLLRSYGVISSRLRW